MVHFSQIVTQTDLKIIRESSISWNSGENKLRKVIHYDSWNNGFPQWYSRTTINTHDNESVQVLVGLTIGSCLTSRKSISVGKLKCVSGGLSFDIFYLKRNTRISSLYFIIFRSFVKRMLSRVAFIVIDS